MIDRKNLTLAVFATTVLALSPACKQLDNMEEMHDSTQRMAETTDKMAKTTDGMAKTTDGMAGNTTELKEIASDTLTAVRQTGHTADQTFEKLRQSGSLGVRESALKRMNEFDAMESKIMEAGAYYKAFEFQLWDNQAADSAKYLEAFYKQAAEEFVRVIPNYMSADHTKRSVSPLATDNTSKNLFALAVSLQELNDNIVIAAKKSNMVFVPQAMADLIEDTLKARLHKEATHTVTAWESELYRNVDNITFLYQVRMNFLAAMTLAKISKIQDNGFLGVPGFFRKLHMILAGWTPTLKNMNPDEVKQVTRFLYGSNSAKQFLKDIGAKPNLDGKLAKIMKDMKVKDLVQKPIAAPKSEADLVFNSQQEELKKFLDQYDIFEGKKEWVKIPALDHPELH